MNSLLVFNHHSLPFDSKEHAEDSIPEFLRLCIRSQNLGLNTILVDEAILKSAKENRWVDVEY